MVFRIWTKSQALCLLLGLMLLTCVVSVMLTLHFQPDAVSAREDAVAVFAQSDTIFVVEAATTPEPTPDTAFRVEVIRHTPSPEADGKRVLIYHSHTYEAYSQDSASPYKETEKWRTADSGHNVIAVGAALASQLRAHGWTVVHDTTAFESPDYDTAYVRSLDMLQERTALGETYDLYIDLHRDGLSSASSIQRTVNVGGIKAARFMVLVGKGTGSGFTEKPDWEANLAIAQRITDCLNMQASGLCRDVKVKTGRFNQHIAPRCVLIECGSNLNTLQEVLDGLPYLAQAIVDAMSTQKKPGA